MENPASLKGKRYAVLSETYLEQDELIEPVRELKRARESDGVRSVELTSWPA